MIRRTTRRLVLGAVLFGIAAAAACTLNPQPLPPEDVATRTPGGGSSSGGEAPPPEQAAADAADGGADADGGDR